MYRPLCARLFIDNEINIKLAYYNNNRQLFTTDPVDHIEKTIYKSIKFEGFILTFILTKY